MVRLNLIVLIVVYKPDKNVGPSFKNEGANMNFNDKMQMGFVAQDVEKIFSEMVFTDEAGYKSID